MKTTKKLLALLLAVLMVLSMLAGCGAKTEAPSAEGEKTTTANASKNEATPEQSEEPIHLDIIPGANGFVAAKDTPVEQMLEERFNVEIEVAELDSMLPETTAVYLAGSPDFDYICANGNYSNYSSWYDQGLLRTFTYEELCEHMPNWMAALEKDVGEAGMKQGEISRSIIEQTHNGELFTIPMSEGPVYYIMAIRQDWLDNLGLEVPTTYDELVAVMEAFTYEDPDGNGIDDTYGIDCHYNYRLNYMHTMYGGTFSNFNLDENGKVVFNPATEGWKESLKRAAEVYAKGVIDPEFATDSRAIVREKWASGKFGVTVDSTTWFADTKSGNVIELLTQNDPNAKLTYLDPWPSEDGTTYLWANTTEPYTLPAGAFGANCTDEQMYAIMEMLDAMVSDFDVRIAVDYGEEGVHWNYSDNGVVTATSAVTNEVKQELGLSMWHRFFTVPFGDEAEKFKSEHVLNLLEQYDGYENVMVYTSFPYSGTNEAFNTYYADVESIELEYYYSAIMGTIDIDATWDDHVASMNAAGLQEIIDEYQAYVDEYIN